MKRLRSRSRLDIWPAVPAGAPPLQTSL